MSSWDSLLSDLQERYGKVLLGGGVEKSRKLRLKSKMTARERIHSLLDSDLDWVEIGAFAGDGMYEEYGGCPSGGIVVIMGYVSGRLCIIAANDPTVKSGAWFPITGKKAIRAQEIAYTNRIPIIYLVDSAGVFLPLQSEVFPDRDHFGRQFYHNARLSEKGVPQLAAVLGSCVAGGAYLPVMADESFIVEGQGSIFLAGSYLVKAAIGEDIDNESLGGAHTQCTLSGVIDNKYPDEKTCLAAIKERVSRLGSPNHSPYNRVGSRDPKKPARHVFESFPTDRTQSYDSYELLDCLIDVDTWQEYKAEYAKTLICGYARIMGWSFGLIANRRTVSKNGAGEIQMGGVIYSDSADKAARFVMNCNQSRIPLLFLQDVSGFMVGSRAERGGIIKDGAKLVSCVSNSVVPKFTVILGNSYGAGNYAMCGRAYDPNLMLAWPTARLGVMSGRSAAQTLLQIEKKIHLRSKEDSAKRVKEIEDRYNQSLSPYYAAARLWIDAVIDPTDTRKFLNMGMLAAQHCSPSDFKMGPIQT
ncbi:MAG: acyl-CoA carboxylase subunit beta [Cytophagales bacterium]|nr:acyl-CoA carboxylase subunit beta [Cytophagales bacterium]